jgi:hypothetical protein
MQAIASPTKRRAVLGSLDANAAMATPGKKVAVVARQDLPVLLLTPSASSSSSSSSISNSALESESAKGVKRGVVEEEVVDKSPAAKKACVDVVS